ncbi:MAG: DUF5667 domain-containing protein [Patescibacteria group bacterium]|jgi:hypothetical protein|nr:DUF5667 domain-containing protein [Patescibacteria group bacterium]
MNNIISEFKNLKDEVSPRSEWVELNRNFLLQQISSSQPTRTRVSLGDYLGLFTAAFRQHLLEPAVVMILILVFSLSSSLTINAAFYSLPGDTLYPVKLALEKTHVSLTPDEQKKVELKIEFAEKRIAEFHKIVAQPDANPQEKQKKIETVVKEFKNNVVAVSNHLNKISQDEISLDQAAKVRMAVAVSEKTEELAKNLDQNAADLSDADKKQFEDAVAEVVASARQLAENIEAQALQSEDQTGSNETKSVDQPGIVEGVDNQTDVSIGQNNSDDQDNSAATTDTESVSDSGSAEVDETVETE